MMAIEYTWTINQLERNTANGGVVRVHWRCQGIEGDHSDSYGKASDFTPDPSAGDFIPYADLTESVVIGWVQNSKWDPADASSKTMKVGVEEFITADITEKKNPVISIGRPW